MWQGLVIHTHLSLSHTYSSVYTLTGRHTPRSQWKGKRRVPVAGGCSAFSPPFSVTNSGWWRPYLEKFAPSPVFSYSNCYSKTQRNVLMERIVIWGTKKNAFAFPYDSLCFHPIKDNKVTHFLIQNPTCFPRFPPTTDTNTDIYQQNRSCWKDFFGCWNGLLSPGHGRLFVVLSPSPGRCTPKGALCNQSSLTCDVLSFSSPSALQPPTNQ